MSYPRMLFPGGDITKPHRIVETAQDEADARRAGYRIAYEADAPKESPEPARKAGPKHKGK